MKKPLFNKVVIVGVGLIGGSIGIDIIRKNIAKRVTGIVRKPQAIARAKRMGAVTDATTELFEGIEDADLIILATPIPIIKQRIRLIADAVSPSTIVIDVGSSKKEIAEIASKYFKKKKFIGCHPMAGKEKIGVVNAEAGLFEGATCFVTVSDPRVNAFWKALGAKPVTLSAETHDAWVARASHLPHILSFSLFQNLKAPNQWPVNPSLKALHRLAQSDPELWADIFISNKKDAIKAIAELQKSLSQFQRALSSGNTTTLKGLIKKANKNAK